MGGLVVVIVALVAAYVVLSTIAGLSPAGPRADFQARFRSERYFADPPDAVRRAYEAAVRSHLGLSVAADPPHELYVDGRPPIGLAQGVFGMTFLISFTPEAQGCVVVTRGAKKVPWSLGGAGAFKRVEQTLREHASSAGALHSSDASTGR